MFGDVSVEQMLVCSHICMFKPPPPRALFQALYFHIQLLFFFKFVLFLNFSMPIVSVECLFIVPPVSAPCLLAGTGGRLQ